MKVEGWEIRLADAIEAAAGRPFQWGQHDCATWAADVRAALTGTDSFADRWRGRYKTPLGARRAVKRLGWASFEAAARDLLGEPLDTVLLAQRGDVVYSGEAFGICTGATAAFPAECGLTHQRLRDCALAWRS